jgi:hypothetical protein
MADAAAKATADGEREVTRILMALDPKSTLAAMAAIRDHAFMERWGAFVRRFQLARMNTNHLMTAVHVHSAVDAVHRTLRAVVTSSQHLTMLVRRLLQSTRAVQRFVRHRLADLRRRKARLVTMWKDAEADARQRIRGAIDALRDRGRGNVASQRFGDALWGLYMDCWGQPDTIAAAVERLWWERRAEYVTRFRRWRLAEVSARRQKMPREGEVSRRIAEGKLGQNFQPLLFSPKSVDLDEIAYQIVLVQLGRPNPRPRLREAYRRGTSEPATPLVAVAGTPAAATAGAATGNHSTVTFADADEASSATPDVPRDPPVSYYHALIRFDAQKPHLAMFLKRLCAGEAITYAESAAKAVQKQLTSARIIHARWAGGKLVATLDMSASKKVIDEDGSPKSRYAAALGDIPLSPRRSPRPGSPEGGSMELSASPPPALTLLAAPQSPRSMIGSPKAPQPPPTAFSPRSTFTSPRAASSREASEAPAAYVRWRRRARCSTTRGGGVRAGVAGAAVEAAPAQRGGREEPPRAAGVIAGKARQRRRAQAPAGHFPRAGRRLPRTCCPGAADATHPPQLRQSAVARGEHDPRRPRRRVHPYTATTSGPRPCRRRIVAQRAPSHRRRTSALELHAVACMCSVSVTIHANTGRGSNRVRGTMHRRQWH